MGATSERRETDPEPARELEILRQAISHELRAPLRAVSGFAHILAATNGPRLDEEGRRCLDSIERAAARMDALCEALLDYLELGRHRVRCEPVSPARAVERVRLRLARPLAAAGGELSVEGPLPEVLGDERLVEVALGALLENGLVHRRDGVAPRIAVRARREGPDVLVEVADNGRGIAAEDLPKVYRPFQRLVSESEAPGLGIGLSRAERALRLQGGSIEARSAPGEGSVFALRLRAAPDPRGEPR